MCNCVRKCVSFPAFPQLVVILPVKRIAGDCRPKSPLPSHKKAPARDSTLSLRAAAIVCFHAKRTTWVCELMAERRQERHFFRAERATGRSRTRGCGLVQLGLKRQLASLLLHFVSKSVEMLSFFQIRASSNRARSFFSAAAYASLPSKSRNGGCRSCVNWTIA